MGLTSLWAADGCRVYEERTLQHMTTIHGQLKPSVGVVLLDAQLRLVHYTGEAATILGYTGDSVPLDFVKAASRFQLTNPSKVASPGEFRSGRRRYRCRAFLLDSDGHAASPQATSAHAFGNHADHLQPKIAVVLERVLTQPADITRWSEAYQLTHREHETVKLLMKGLTSKEIANEMSISPSTVKSFLKLIMTKVGASSRTGIIAKILEKAS
jgi:DNA-binding CsgD family transcriptional regulator